MRILAVLTLFISACSGQVLGPFSSSVNFATNLLGPPDTRPETWGNAATEKWTVTFSPPAGYQVRILEVHGDLISFIVTLPGDTTVVPPQTAAGVLLGLQTSDPAQSGRCDYCSDVLRRQPNQLQASVQGTTMLYIQDSVAQLMPKSRASYDRPAVNTLLQPDNKLIVTVASWLNNTTKSIHIEPTFVVTYQFEPATTPAAVAPAVRLVKGM